MNMEKDNYINGTPLAEFILAERKKVDGKREMTNDELATFKTYLKHLFINERRQQIYLIASLFETNVTTEKDNLNGITLYVPKSTIDYVLSYLKENKFVVEQDHDYNRWFISLPKI